ncbi:MAG: hypothetical protein EXS64_17065 [Candidatus Latescibacteria bacterium]|nr:hypothetical protein [Candidatus Latescibacterota bacterium]
MKQFLLAVCCFSLVGLMGCGGDDLGPVQDLGAITVRAPSAWKTETPTSGMRKAQYTLPKAKTDHEDASLIVFYFGQSQGGSVEDNLARWYGQFQQSDGSASKDKAKVDKKTVSGMPVTVVDVSGTYSPGSMNPMMGAGPEPKPGYRMLAAIVETAQGAYFFKLTGPEHTVEQGHKSFDRFIDQIQKK